MDTVYQLLCLLFTLLTATLLVHTVSRRKYLLVKPSMWFVIFLHLQIQWSSVSFAVEIYNRLYYPVDFFILTQIFPLLFVLFTRITYLKESKYMFSCLRNFLFAENDRYLGKVFQVCVLLAIPIVLYYLMNIPFAKTGLFEIIFGNDAKLANSAREESLKLASASIRYSYVFFNKTLAVAIGMISVLRLQYYFRQGELRKIIMPIVTIIIVVFASSFSGARSHGVYVLLGSVCPLIFTSQIKINPLKLAGMVLAFLFIPVSLQLQKFDLDFTLQNVIEGYDKILIHRTLSVPMMTGLNWIDYVQKHGYWGVSGVSFLQGFGAGEPKAVPNLMMNYYNERVSVETGLMNTSFIFSYYSYFGYFSFLLLVPLVLLLDTVLYFIKRFSPELMLLATSSLCLSCINLVNTEYHTIFLSYGFATGLVFYSLVRKLVPKTS